MRRVDIFSLAAIRLLVVIPVVINLLTPLINIEWYKRWWWLLLALLVFAVWPSIYLRQRHNAVIRRIAAASNRAGTLFLFAVTEAGDVLRRELREEEAWSDWEDHGFKAGKAMDVAAVVPGSGRLESYIVDSKGMVWGRRRGREGWSAWAPVETSHDVGAVVALDAMSGWPGHRELYVVNDGGQLFHRWQWDGEPWDDWYPAHRTDCLDVALSVPSQGSLECFIVNRDGETWHRWFANHDWSSWDTLNRPKMRSPSVAISALNSKDSHQEIFVIGSAGDVAHRWHFGGDTWDKWEPVPAPAEELNDVAAAATSRGRYEVVAVGRSGKLWRRSYRASGIGWSSWQSIPD